MLRSTDRFKIPSSHSWKYLARLPVEWRGQLQSLADQRGGTLLDEVLLAIDAHLQRPVMKPIKQSGITLSDHQDIRNKYRRGHTQASLAREYGVSRQRINQLLKADQPFQ